MQAINSQTKIYMDVSSDINFIVTDPSGKKTGIDSRYSKPYNQWTWYKEIPNATIGFEGIGDGSPSIVLFESRMDTSDAYGNYTFQFISDTLEVFDFLVESFPLSKNSLLQKVRYDLKNIPIDNDSVVTYHFNYHGALGFKTSLIKVVSPRTLIQDVSAMQKLGWIQSQTTSQNYIQLYSTISSQMSNNDTPDARSTLNTVLNQLRADSGSAISGDAYKLLNADTKQLLKSLPNISQCLVKLLSSTSSLLTGGTLQYRDSTWRDAANNNDGTFTFTTALKKTSLRMTYAYGTETKSNVTIKNDSTIIFQTKNVAVNLQNSQGNPLDTGIVQYNSTSGWQNFGTTSNGGVTNELLPIKYTFRLSYNSATVIKAQNIDSNATVVFQTIPTSVQLQTSTGVLLDAGVVQYNANGPVGAGWQNYGITSNGVASKELLPTKYTFHMTYNGATVNKAQSLDSNATVVFQTVPANVQLQTSTGAPLDTGLVQFNAGGPVGAGWKNFGTTTNGVVTKELLPTKYTFRITYNGATISESQSIDSNATVIFQTVRTLVQFNNSLGNPIDTGVVQFNSGGWQNYGSTSNGIVSKELLPVKYTFRLTYCGSTVSIAQNVDSNATVVFSTVLCTVSVTNSSGSLLNNAIVSYNAGGWKVIGTTINGIVTIELLPAKIQFRAAYGSKQQSVTQDVSINPFIPITLPVQ
jgi:hypothetical protein